ncbi:hypothetical protein [Actinoplanes sp. NPDC051851]|uniref:hypothetical protein n=1 Tax=Actinoplanes sp. NPDC051851 TaxID=3154753 RepID=UPI0034225266
MTTDALIEVGKVAGAVVAVAAMLSVANKALRSLRRLGHLADEVLGDGKKPGWGQRIESLETGQVELTKLVKGIDHEVRPNSGGSMRDAVDRIAQATGAHDS